MKVKLKPLQEILDAYPHTINAVGHVYFDNDQGGIHPSMYDYFGKEHEVNFNNHIRNIFHIVNEDKWSFHKSWIEGHTTPVKTKFCTIEDI